MGHSFKVLKMNFFRYFNVFYDYFLKTIYWGSVPTIILYGKPAAPFETSRPFHQALQPNRTRTLAGNHRSGRAA